MTWSSSFALRSNQSSTLPLTSCLRLLLRSLQKFFKWQLVGEGHLSMQSFKNNKVRQGLSNLIPKIWCLGGNISALEPLEVLLHSSDICLQKFCIQRPCSRIPLHGKYPFHAHPCRPTLPSRTGRVEISPREQMRDEACGCSLCQDDTFLWTVYGIPRGSMIPHVCYTDGCGFTDQGFRPQVRRISAL